MATKKPRRPADDEAPPVRGKIVVPIKSVAKRPALGGKKKPVAKKAAPRKRTVAEDIDAFGDEQDEAEVITGLAQPEMEGIAQHSRRTIELEAQMRARVSGEPVFPYPPELQPELRPYWQELVNSFPKDHFQVSDTTMMKMYCQCAYDIERQNIKIGEEGEVVIGGRGNAIVNPRCKVRESNRATLLALATKFRNQPASRTNTTNFKNRRDKATAAAGAATSIMQDEDNLLASPEDFDDSDDAPQTRH